MCSTEKGNKRLFIIRSTEQRTHQLRKPKQTCGISTVQKTKLETP